MRIDEMLATLTVLAVVILGYRLTVRKPVVEHYVIKPDVKFEKNLNKIFRYDNIRTTPLFDENTINEIVEE